MCYDGGCGCVYLNSDGATVFVTSIRDIPDYTLYPDFVFVGILGSYVRPMTEDEMLTKPKFRHVGIKVACKFGWFSRKMAKHMYASCKYGYVCLNSQGFIVYVTHIGSFNEELNKWKDISFVGGLVAWIRPMTRDEMLCS
jgi:hypothetical protein